MWGVCVCGGGGGGGVNCKGENMYLPYGSCSKALRQPSGVVRNKVENELC